jgi:ornithine cyclodeaminase
MSSHAKIPLRILSRQQVESLLPVEDCIPVIRDAMVQVSRDRAQLPLRHGLKIPGRDGMLGMMYGSMAEPESFGIKLVSLFPNNRSIGLSTHMGLMVLYDSEHGRPRALIDASALTAIRTAAASAVATDVLARSDSQVLAVLGTGEQAAFHLSALLHVRRFRSVRMWGRSKASVDGFIGKLRISPMPHIHVSDAPADAVRESDVVCTVTSSPVPILAGDDVRPGTHVNLVGSSMATAREVDSQFVARARFYCDLRESLLAQGGEFLRAIEEGVIAEAHLVGEIGSVIDGVIPGRREPSEITVYKSLGVFAQDLAAATQLLHAAERLGVGTVVEL